MFLFLKNGTSFVRTPSAVGITISVAYILYFLYIKNHTIHFKTVLTDIDNIHSSSVDFHIESTMSSIKSYRKHTHT